MENDNNNIAYFMQYQSVLTFLSYETTSSVIHPYESEENRFDPKKQ